MGSEHVEYLATDDLILLANSLLGEALVITDVGLLASAAHGQKRRRLGSMRARTC